VSLTGGTANFDNPNVGSNKTVTATGFTLSGGDSGNYALASTTLTAKADITPWSAAGKGFYAPVGVANSIFTAAPNAVPSTFVSSSMVWNTVKGGQTVPLKFNVYAGTVEQTGNSAFPGSDATNAFHAAKMTSCTNLSDTDPVDYTIVATGSTMLRYDPTGAQWIYNWATPKVTQTTCYRTWVAFADGSTLEAFFQLSK
jgi:YDG domain